MDSLLLYVVPAVLALGALLALVAGVVRLGGRGDPPGRRGSSRDNGGWGGGSAPRRKSH